MSQENEVVDWIISTCKLKSMHVTITSDGYFDFETGMKSELLLVRQLHEWFWEGRYGHCEPLEASNLNEFMEELNDQIEGCLHGRPYFSTNVEWVFNKDKS